MEVRKLMSTSGLEVDLPQFVHNRYDMLYQKDQVQMYAFDVDGITNIVEVRLKSCEEAELGIWLIKLPDRIFDEIVRQIFIHNKKLKIITYKNSLCSYKGLGMPGNHFHIVLPDSYVDLESRLSSKGRYNIRREKRIIEKDFGIYTIIDYSLNEAPKDVVDYYFVLKKKTHEIDCAVSAHKYMENTGVTNIYVLAVGNERKIIAMALSCEQCGHVYLENITYDINFSKYSPGQVLYDEYLRELIKKEKKQVYLLGGQLEYKKRYGSIENTIYNGVIYRSALKRVALFCKVHIKFLIHNTAQSLSPEMKNIIKRLILSLPSGARTVLMRAIGIKEEVLDATDRKND